MTRKPIFVGRKAELKQFDEVLRSPEGQAVLVVGQQAMGKTDPWHSHSALTNRQQILDSCENDLPGKWTLRVTDLQTGKSMEHSFELITSFSKVADRPGKRQTHLAAKGDSTHFSLRRTARKGGEK